MKKEQELEKVRKNIINSISIFLKYDSGLIKDLNLFDEENLKKIDKISEKLTDEAMYYFKPLYLKLKDSHEQKEKNRV